MPIRKDWTEFKMENLAGVPDKDGVFELGDAAGEIIYIGGTANLKQDLAEKLHETDKAHFFRYEEDFLYSQRQNELIAVFMRQFKRLPELNDELM